MYALTVLDVENYPPINEQIEMFNVLLPSKAYPVIAPIFNTFYVNGIYIMVLFSFERFYTISVIPKRRYLSLKRIKISIILVFLTSAVYRLNDSTTSDFSTPSVNPGLYTRNSSTPTYLVEKFWG